MVHKTSAPTWVLRLFSTSSVNGDDSFQGIMLIRALGDKRREAASEVPSRVTYSYSIERLVLLLR